MSQQPDIIKYLTEKSNMGELHNKTRTALNMYFFRKESLAPSFEDREKARKEALAEMEKKRISGVVHLLSFRDEVIQEHAILQIIQRFEKENVEIREKGGLKPIVEALNSSSPSIQLQAAKALAVMISYDESTLEAMLELNAVPIIVNLIASSNASKFIKFLLFITYNLSLSDKNWGSLHQAGVIPIICELLKRSEEESIQKMILKIIGGLSVDEGNRKAIQRSSGVEKAVTLLSGRNLRYDVVKVLVHFSRTDEGCNLICVYDTIPVLLALLSSLVVNEATLQKTPLSPPPSNVNDLASPKMPVAQEVKKSPPGSKKIRNDRSVTSPLNMVKKKGLFGRLLKVLDRSEVESTVVTTATTEPEESAKVSQQRPLQQSQNGASSELNIQNKLILLILKTLRNLTRNESCRAAITHYDGVRLLLRYTSVTVPKQYMIKALKALSCLSAGSMCPGRDVILDNQPRHLLTLLNHSDRKIFVATASIITNISETEKFVERMGIDNLMNILTYLKNNNAILHQVVLKVCRHCAHNEEFKDGIVRNGYVKLLVDTLLKADNEKVLIKVVIVLLYLGIYPEIKQALVLTNIATRLLDLLSFYTSEILEINVLKVLFLLTEGDYACSVVQLSGTLQLLTSLMYKPYLAEYSCRITYNLLTDENAMMEFVKGGGLDTALFLLFFQEFPSQSSGLVGDCSHIALT